MNPQDQRSSSVLGTSVQGKPGVRCRGEPTESAEIPRHCCALLGMTVWGLTCWDGGLAGAEADAGEAVEVAHIAVEVGYILAAGQLQWRRIGFLLLPPVFLSYLLRGG